MSSVEVLKLAAGLLGDVWQAPTLPRPARPHRHDELEFNLVTSGGAAYLVEDRRYVLTPGTLIWLYPEQDHVLVGDTPQFQMWVAVFRPQLIRQVCTEPTNAALRQTQPSLPICRQLSPHAGDDLARECRRVADAKGSPDLANAGLGYLLLSAWEAFQEAAAPGAVGDVHPAVERAARMIRDQPQPAPIQVIAQQVNLSPSHLSRLFQAQAGVSITRYRQQCCLARFAEAYGRGNRLNLMEASLAAGFGSYAQFHRVFTDYFGFGPAEYRRRVRRQRD